MRWFLLVLLALAAQASPIPADTRQLVLVITPAWGASEAVLQRYERAEASSPWTAAGDAAPARVGRNGLGWGRGLHPAPGGDGPVKKEGDGRAPAGVFRLSAAFGDETAALDPVEGLPFLLLTPTLEGVDDPKSVHYNRIVDRSQVEDVDWTSSEKMQIDPYRVGIVVDHNSDPPVPGGGSCIFLHLWKGPEVATSGCTALAEDRCRELATWLRRDARPVLVQLPRSEFDARREAWGLPDP